MLSSDTAKFLKFFPGIVEYLQLEEIRSTEIAQIQPGFLYCTPKHKRAISTTQRCDLSMGQIFLLDRPFRRLCEVGVPNGISRLNPFAWVRDQSVGDAIQHLKNPDDAYFALAISPIRFSFDGSKRVIEGRDVVFFKPHEEFTLRQWLSEQQRKTKDPMWNSRKVRPKSWRGV